MNRYEELLSFTKRYIFIFLGFYLLFYGILNFVSLFLKDVFYLLFK